MQHTTSISSMDWLGLYELKHKLKNMGQFTRLFSWISRSTIFIAT